MLRNILKNNHPLKKPKDNLYIFHISYIRMGKEEIELAEEHIKMAQDIVEKESRKADKTKMPEKEFTEAQFALEKAEAEICDLKGEEKKEE